LPASLLYFAECVLAHGKALPSVREKTLGKNGFAVTFFAMCGLPSVALGKSFAERKRAFAECTRHSANRLSPVVTQGFRELIDRKDQPNIQGSECLFLQI